MNSYLNEKDIDFFHIEDNINDNGAEDFLYVVKKSIVIEEWKKRKVALERRDRLRQKSH